MHTYAYIGSARYSRIQDSHVMAPTSKPKYGANEVANLAMTSLADSASTIAIPAGTNPPARERTGGFVPAGTAIADALSARLVIANLAILLAP